MKTCFSTLACPTWSLSEALAAASRYGFDGIELRALSGELDLWKLPEFSPTSLKTTRRTVANAGITIPCLDSSGSFHSPDAGERNKNYESAVRMASLAAQLGVPAVRVFGDRIQPGASRQQTENWIRDSLARLVERLEPDGVAVWLETHGDFAGGCEVKNLLETTVLADVGIIWDPANAYAQDNDPPVIENDLRGRIRHVHVKDLIRDQDGAIQYVLTGRGQFPFDTMFSSLAAINYDGFMSFEWEKLWHPELADPEIALPHFIEWWKNRWLA